MELEFLNKTDLFHTMLKSLNRANWAHIKDLNRISRQIQLVSRDTKELKCLLIQNAIYWNERCGMNTGALEELACGRVDRGAPGLKMFDNLKVHYALFREVRMVLEQFEMFVGRYRIQC